MTTDLVRRCGNDPIKLPPVSAARGASLRQHKNFTWAAPQRVIIMSLGKPEGTSAPFIDSLMNNSSPACYTGIFL